MVVGPDFIGMCGIVENGNDDWSVEHGKRVRTWIAGILKLDEVALIVERSRILEAAMMGLNAIIDIEPSFNFNTEVESQLNVNNQQRIDKAKR